MHTFPYFGSHMHNNFFSPKTKNKVFVRYLNAWFLKSKHLIWTPFVLVVGSGHVVSFTILQPWQRYSTQSTYSSVPPSSYLRQLVRQHPSISMSAPQHHSLGPSMPHPSRQPGHSQTTHTHFACRVSSNSLRKIFPVENSQVYLWFVLLPLASCIHVEWKGTAFDWIFIGLSFGQKKEKIEV